MPEQKRQLQHEVIKISVHDQKAFVQALLNAAEPSQRLLKAKKHFDKKVKNKNG